jgi:hypothetical protein
MSDGNLPGRDDRPTPRNAGALGVRRLGWTTLAVLLLAASSGFAEAQRPSRRWRSAPPAPRVQTAPRAPQPSAAAAAPRTGNQQAGTQSSSPKQPAAGGKEATQEGKNTSAQNKQPGKAIPQTAANPETPPPPSTGDSEKLVWDGPAPFSEAWRADHPGAWRPEEGAGEIVLAGGVRVPTRVDSGAVDVAQWTARDRQTDATAPRSVLQASAEQASAEQASAEQASAEQASAEVALPDGAIPPSDLIVFPGAEGGVPAAAIPAASPNTLAGDTAADGTVSVLVRDGVGPSSTAKPTAGASATVSLAHEESSSPWLPLGTFAAVPAGSDRSLAPHLFLELALHRDGTVRGNYFDAVSDAVHPVKGRFNREIGSLSWQIGSGGAEFETTAEGLAAGRGEAIVRRGTTERPWVLIGLP